MVKTIVVLEDGKITHTIDENDWDGVEVKDGKLISKAEELSAAAGEPAGQRAQEDADMAGMAAREQAAGGNAAEDVPQSQQVADVGERAPSGAGAFGQPTQEHGAGYAAPMRPQGAAYGQEQPAQENMRGHMPPPWQGAGAYAQAGAVRQAGGEATYGFGSWRAQGPGAAVGQTAQGTIGVGQTPPEPPKWGAGYGQGAYGTGGAGISAGGALEQGNEGRGAENVAAGPGETAAFQPNAAGGPAEPGGARQMYEWREPVKAEKKAKAKWFDFKKVVSVALIALLSATAGFGGGLAASGFAPKAMVGGAAQSINITPTEQVSTTEAVAAKVIPSVVGITSSSTQRFDNFLFGAYDQEVGGTGTGIIVDKGGYILTNSHVVMDGNVDSITVLLPDSREVEGQVLWSDKSLDLAIVKVEATDLVAAELGDSDTVNIGAYVAAIGNPLGLDFRSSVSQGVVSGLDRTITASDSSGYSNAVQMEGLMQVDAAINSGNSGGPLVDKKGQVIGINTAKAQTGEGMGFAIPINVAKPIVENVKETGEFHRVYIGITPYDVAALLQAYPHLDLGVEKGAFVDSVTPGSPAERAGIKKNDVITELNGKEVKSSADLIKQLLGYKAGDKVTLTVVREKKSMTIDVVLTDSLDPQS